MTTQDVSEATIDEVKRRYRMARIYTSAVTLLEVEVTESQPEEIPQQFFIMRDLENLCHQIKQRMTGDSSARVSPYNLYDWGVKYGQMKSTADFAVITRLEAAHLLCLCILSGLKLQFGKTDNVNAVISIAEHILNNGLGVSKHGI